MAQFILGARMHDYGKGTPDEMFGKLAADGYTWGYGTTDGGVAGWIVVDNEWTELLDAA